MVMDKYIAIVCHPPSHQSKLEHSENFWMKIMVLSVVSEGGGSGGLDNHPIKIILTWCEKIWMEIFVM